MGHWNHRVIQETLKNGDNWFSVREVYYNDDGSIYAYTEEASKADGETIEGVKEYLKWCLNALDKPILIDGEVKFIEPEDAGPDASTLPEKEQK